MVDVLERARRSGSADTVAALPFAIVRLDSPDSQCTPRSLLGLLWLLLFAPVLLLLLLL